MIVYIRIYLFVIYLVIHKCLSPPQTMTVAGNGKNRKNPSVTDCIQIHSGVTVKRRVSSLYLFFSFLPWIAGEIDTSGTYIILQTNSNKK